MLFFIDITSQYDTIHSTTHDQPNMIHFCKAQETQTASIHYYLGKEPKLPKSIQNTIVDRQHLINHFYYLLSSLPHEIAPDHHPSQGMPSDRQSPALTI